MESFFDMLKTESCIITVSPRVSRQGRCLEYVEVFYNRARHHAKIGNLAPATSVTGAMPETKSRHNPYDLPSQKIGYRSVFQNQPRARADGDGQQNGILTSMQAYGKVLCEDVGKRGYDGEQGVFNSQVHRSG